MWMRMTGRARPGHMSPMSLAGEIVLCPLTMVRKPRKVILSPAANIQMICLRLMSPLCWRASEENFTKSPQIDSFIRIPSRHEMCPT